MNKIKYIHNKEKIHKKCYDEYKKIKHKPIHIEDYERLAFREKIKPIVRKNYKTYLSFWNICEKYLKSKIGEYWDDVYSDMIKKTKPKYRHLLDEYISFGNPAIPSYYFDFIPCKISWYKNNFSDMCVIFNEVYINIDGILTYNETLEETLIIAKNDTRKEKLKRILMENDINVEDYLFF